MAQEIQRYDEKPPEVVQERPWVAPRVDIYENDSEVLLLADVPGVQPDQLTVHLEKDRLSLEGRVIEETPTNVLGQEYQLRDYRRTFAVPTGIDGTRIKAELTQGVLRLHLPKSEALKPRQITVKAG